MSEQDPIKAAEQRGYSKGYAAGQRRVVREDERREHSVRKEEFRRQTFLAALPALMISGTWEMGGKKVITSDEHCQLAWRIADQATKGTWFP